MLAIRPFPSIYYRSLLRPAARPLYDAIVAAMQGRRTGGQASWDTSLELGTVMEAMQLDHPELFFLDSGGCKFWHAGPQGSCTLHFELAWKHPPGELERRVREIEAAAETLLRGMEDLTPAARALRLHDALAQSVRYSEENPFPPDAYTIEGPFLRRACVCEGFSKAYKYLLNRAGVICIAVSGQAVSPAGHWENHAWNLVYLDGRWHHVDVTWDRWNTESFISHGHFLLSDAGILSAGHRLIGPFALPACPMDACPVPTVHGVPELVRALADAAKTGAAASEFRVCDVPEDGSALMSALAARAQASLRRDWYNRMDSTRFSAASHIFTVLWKEKKRGFLS